MTDKLKAQREAKADVFKALAHPSRIFVVSELAKGEQCVCRLTEKIGADKSTVSKHLSILKRAGIIRDERRGNMIFYSLAAPCVLNFMKCVDGMLAANLKKLTSIHG